jgi:protein-tyrosine-phosphatase
MSTAARFLAGETAHATARPARVLVLCTGNAARSVMGGVGLTVRRPDVEVVTAGTLAVDGLPFSHRTRSALDAVGLPHPKHASKQVTDDHLEWADVVIAMAPEHVEWVRRNNVAASRKTGTLIHLVNSLDVAGRELADRVAELELADHLLTPAEEVIDPGGGEVDAFITCAQHVDTLIERFAALI